MRHIIDKRTFPFNFILKDKNIINKCIQGKDENYFPFCKISHPSHLLHNGRKRERERGFLVTIQSQKKYVYIMIVYKVSAYIISQFPKRPYSKAT